MFRLFLFIIAATFLNGMVNAGARAQERLAVAAAPEVPEALQQIEAHSAGQNNATVRRYATPSAMEYQISGRDIEYSDAEPVSADGPPTSIRPDDGTGA